jgi:hypothetical protein
MTASLFSLPGRVVSWLSSGLAQSLTELLRYFYRLSGVDVKPRAICLNSVCALPVSTLPIDSTIFQRTLTTGVTFFVWAFVTLAILAAVQAAIRATAAPGCRAALFLRRAVTPRTVLIAFGCALTLAAAVAVCANFRSLAWIAAPYRGMEWASTE